MKIWAIYSDSSADITFVHPFITWRKTGARETEAAEEGACVGEPGTLFAIVRSEPIVKERRRAVKEEGPQRS